MTRAAAGSTVSATEEHKCRSIRYHSLKALYRKEMAEPLHLAAGFAAIENGEVMLRGIVDEYAVELGPDGMMATICGRGYAARLLDNESRPVTYQGTTLAEIVRCHVTPYGISCGELANIAADSIYTVAAGTSQWKALENSSALFIEI